MIDLPQLFWDKVQRTRSGCWEWQGICDRNGYGRFRLKRDGVVVVDKKSHRYAFELTYGHLPKLLRHTCDNPPCVRPTHLLPGDHKSNGRDASERGLLVHVPAKLSEQDRAEIRRLRAAEGLSYPALAELFDVSYETVRRVLRKGP